jgi:hypothetical protein
MWLYSSSEIQVAGHFVFFVLLYLIPFGTVISSVLDWLRYNSSHVSEPLTLRHFYDWLLEATGMTHFMMYCLTVVLTQIHCDFGQGLYRILSF